MAICNLAPQNHNPSLNRWFKQYSTFGKSTKYLEHLGIAQEAIAMSDTPLHPYSVSGPTDRAIFRLQAEQASMHPRQADVPEMQQQGAGLQISWEEPEETAAKCTTDPMLSSLLDRLSNVEALCSNILTDRTVTDPAVQSTPASSNDDIDNQESEFIIEGVATDVSLLQLQNLDTPGGHSVQSPISPSGNTLDPLSLLDGAIQKMKDASLENYSENSEALIFEIPKDKAKLWVNEFFINRGLEMWPNLINEQLMRIIPDLAGLPHVHIDQSAMLVYYNVLIDGALIRSTLAYGDMKWARRIYHHCRNLVSAWDQGTTCTAMDFVAAILMCRTSAANFDYDLCWELHSRACRFAQNLSLQSMDDYLMEGRMPKDHHAANEDRKGFWQLLALDYHFRLCFDRPPTISGLDYQVNLPSFDIGRLPPQEVTSATAFIVTSRITFIMMDFFKILENSKSASSDIEGSINNLCSDITNIIEDWQVETWLRQSLNDFNVCWTASDLLLTAYMSIIMMQRKIHAADDSRNEKTIVQSESGAFISLNAARKVLDTINLLMESFTSPWLISWIWGAYQCPFAIASIYDYVLSEKEDSRVLADMKQMLRAEALLKNAVRVHADLTPLWTAFTTLNTRVGEHWTGLRQR
ncbi:hypothetical protein PFICI_10790 [Pestalotiopsis fici W106-1]|uniref:Xylanolytic transcriptional activator regulatory domain-containing protein n=1 Tax=Pestalotiopsis fici (strain W106-1 / CGMCC3.15140) TaxID=1229662 RepID=W3WVP3_PESFW|nr:uncharacterized protein PFICI_10790 [Pestalotiopsis fici W106-1]ETS76916.1 hypothetical protein PFICI_10790 [Pestalotiopsis fici W106-1]